jgi:putative acetyltransferase
MEVDIVTVQGNNDGIHNNDTKADINDVDHMSLVDVARRLFREYAAELDAEQCLARLETELVELPGSYTVRHRGVLYLARTMSTGSEDDSSCEKRWVGCVAVRQWSTAIGSTHGSGCDNAAELKRLYVRSAFCHGGIGRALVQAALEFCRTHDYTALRLETLTRSTAVQQRFVCTSR